VNIKRFESLPVTVVAEGGLWEYCVDQSTKPFIPTKCTTLTGLNLPDWLKATQALFILALIFSLGALVVAVLTLFTEKVKTIHTSILLIIPGVCGLTAMTIFFKKTEYPQIPYLVMLILRANVGYKFGWSYALGWVGSILSLLSAVVGIAMKTIDTMRNR